MTNLSQLRKYYSTNDATAVAADVALGKIAYGAAGKVVGTALSFSPLSISNLYFWLDASNRGTVANRWDDVSGNGRHFTVASPAGFPTFAGGIATCRADTLSGPNLSSLTAGEIFVLQARYADNADANADSGWMRFGTQTDSQVDHFTYDSTIYSGFGRSTRLTVGNPTPSTADWTIINIISGTSDWRLYMNEYLIYSTTTNTPAFNSVPYVLGSSSDGGQSFYGSVKAILFYNRVLNSLERARVRGYLATL